MHTLNIAAIAVALAMDAFAVAIASGVSLKIVGFRRTFRLGWHFGLFQALMPILGWTAGLTIRSFIEQYDHWVAFGLLAFVGSNMVRGAFQHGKDRGPRKDPTKGTMLVMLSVATSIDALAVGLSMAMLKISIWVPALIIGIVATVFTSAGLHLGKKLGSSSHLSRYADVVGGVVLFVIGLNILREHGVLAF